LSKKPLSHNPRSTVGTVTEIHDYLRLLFARAAIHIVRHHDLVLQAQSVGQMVDHVLELPAGTRIMILSPLVVERKGEQLELFDELRAQGFTRLRINGVVHEIDALPSLQKNKKHTIEIVVDRLKVGADVKQRLAESFETALRHAEGRALAVEMDSGASIRFRPKFACPICSYSLPELEPRLFSFNNPMGACPKCDGWAISVFLTQNVSSLFRNSRSALAQSKAGTGAISFIINFLQAWLNITISTWNNRMRVCQRRLNKLVLYGSGKSENRI